MVVGIDWDKAEENVLGVMEMVCALTGMWDTGVHLSIKLVNGILKI